MKTLIAGNLKSKTSLVGLALIVLGGLDQSGALTALLDLIPVEYRGTAVSVFGGVMLVLRNLTSTSIAGKAVAAAAPPTQGGFARVSMLITVLLAAAAATFLAGCQTTPTGEKQLSEEGRAALEISSRIAVRHFLDDARAAEKIQHIREIAAQLQAITSAESTLAALTAVVSDEIDKLELSPIDKADAQDLLMLLTIALEKQLGSDALQSEGVVKVNEFLTLILSVLPSGPVAAGPTSSAQPPK